MITITKLTIKKINCLLIMMIIITITKVIKMTVTILTIIFLMMRVYNNNNNTTTVLLKKKVNTNMLMTITQHLQPTITRYLNVQRKTFHGSPYSSTPRRSLSLRDARKDNLGLSHTHTSAAC